MSTATVGFFSLQTACLLSLRDSLTPQPNLQAKVSSHLISVFSILQILTTHTPPSLLPRIPLYSCPYLVLPFILLAFSFAIISHHTPWEGWISWKKAYGKGLASLSEQAREPGAIYIFSDKQWECPDGPMESTRNCLCAVLHFLLVYACPILMN